MTMPASVTSGVTVQSFGSGSSGNALLVKSASSAFLVDCGVGIRALRAGLAGHHLTEHDLDVILVTHEHRDHVQTLPKVLRDGLPLVATRGTAKAARLPLDLTTIITDSTPAHVAGATIHPLFVRHDACEPCGFFIEIDGACITVLTDLGSWQNHLLEATMASDLVLLEANYNDTMLQHGPYPAHLKRRVASVRGHLGNDACGAALAPVVKRRGDTVTWWLAHLSATNNSARQAEHDVREFLHQGDVDASITALPRQQPGPVWRLDECRRSTGYLQSMSGITASQLGMPGFN